MSPQCGHSTIGLLFHVLVFFSFASLVFTANLKATESNQISKSTVSTNLGTQQPFFNGKQSDSNTIRFWIAITETNLRNKGVPEELKTGAAGVYLRESAAIVFISLSEDPDLTWERLKKEILLTREPKNTNTTRTTINKASTKV